MHEQSETIQNKLGKWINVYGKATPQAGQQLPGTPEYGTSDEAVAAARSRSEQSGKASVVEIRGVGNVEFPESMTPDQVSAAAKKLYDENNAPPVKERLKAAGRYLTPFPGAVAGLLEPESELGKAARKDPGIAANPMPQAVQDLFGAAQEGARKLGLGKEFEAGMAIAPFHGVPGVKPAAESLLRKVAPGKPAPAPTAQPQAAPAAAAQPATQTVTTPTSTTTVKTSSPQVTGDIAAQIAALEKENAALRQTAAPTQPTPSAKPTAAAAPAADPLTAVKDAIRKQVAGQPLTPAETAALKKYGMGQPKEAPVRPGVKKLSPADEFAESLKAKTPDQLAAMRIGDMRPKIGSAPDLAIQAELKRRDPSAGRAEFRQQIEDAKGVLDDPNANLATKQMAQEMLDTAGVKYAPKQVSHETPPVEEVVPKGGKQLTEAAEQAEATKPTVRDTAPVEQEMAAAKAAKVSDADAAIQAQIAKLEQEQAGLKEQLKPEIPALPSEGNLPPKTPDISMTKTAEVPKETLFRGGEPFEEGKVTEWGLSLTVDPSVAKRFSKKTEGGGVEWFSLKPNTKIIAMDDLLRVIARDTGTTSEHLSQYKSLMPEIVATEAKKRGYDAVDMRGHVGHDIEVMGGLPEKEIRVLNPNVLIREGPSIGESSEVSHKRAAAWAKEEVEKLRDMTAEQRADYFKQDQLQAQAIVQAEKQAAEAQVLTRRKAQHGAITMPGLQGISSWLDRTLKPKDLMQGIIREHSGERVLTDERARWATKQAQAEWEKRPIGDSVRFWDSMENGRPQVNAADQPLADILRTKLDQMQTQIQNLGTGKLQHWVDNYYPHLWEKQGPLAQVAGKVFGKRPLAGPATGLKHRTIPTMTEGMSHRVYSQQGDFLRAFPDDASAQAAAARIPGATVHDPLKPLTYNPVDMALLRLAEMNRYVMAHKIKDAAKNEGLVQFVRFGHKPPDGWAMLDDKIFRVLQHTPQGMVVRGQYYAPKEAARSFNNFLSPGLKGNWAHDILRSTGNTLNQAQLGLSGFHAGFTTIETGVSDLALAVQKFSRGDFGGAIKPAARALSGYSFIENPMTGGKVLKEYLEPGSRAAYARTVEAMKMAGGRPFQSPEFTNASIKAFKKGVQEGDIGKIARKMVPAFFEWQSKPIMEKLVPRQKLGVFHKMAEDVFQRADAEGWHHEKIRHEMQRVWDSVDNREGQMVYDNLFWNKTMKDIGFMSVRSLGWNLGTKREFIGGALDLPKEVLRAATGRGFEVGPRVAYALALPAYVGFLGAVMTYLYTGKGPETIKDLYFIKTGKTDAFGKEERISLPSYMKDIFGLSHHPWDTLKHKIHPMISAVADMLENEDFYGTQIRDPDDPGVKQLQDVATYMGEQFLPFSVRNARQRAKQQGETDIGALYNPTHPDFAKNLGGTAQSIIGVTPSPRYATQSQAEELAARYGGMRVPRERTQAEQVRADFARTLENRQRLGKLKPDELGNALVKGQITPGQIKELLVGAQTPYLLKATKRLKLDQALNVWEQADDKEKSLIKESVIKKAPLLLNYPPEKRPELQKRLQGVASHGGQP